MDRQRPLDRGQSRTGDLKLFCFRPVNVSHACVNCLQIVTGQRKYNFGEALARPRNSEVNPKI